MKLDPQTASASDLYRMVTSAIVPRPIAWISTASPEGVPNLAPFSFFSAVHYAPPTLAISLTHKRDGEDWVKKDSLRNLEASGELVVNVTTEVHMEQINTSSANYPAEVSEFGVTGLTPVRGDKVAAPRVQECSISMECRLTKLVPLGDERPATLVLAEVVLFHVADQVWDPAQRRVDIQKLGAVSRLGGTLFASVGELHSYERPKV